MSKFRTIVLMSIILIISFSIYYFTYYLPRTKYINENKIPAKFLLDGLSFDYYTPEDNVNLPINQKEYIRPGAKYVLNKNGDEAIKEIFTVLEKEGWVAIDGSNREGNNAMIKINNSKETLIIQVTERTDGTKISSEIVILSVTK